MHVLIYQDCYIMGIFFTKKGAKKARDKLIAHDAKTYPNYQWRSQKMKTNYRVEKHPVSKLKYHEDPFKCS